MTAADGPGSRSMCQVLREDPELAEAIPAERRMEAVAQCVAPAHHLRAGGGVGHGTPPLLGGLGMLVLEGILIRRVGIDGRFGAELLGEGDLLRPWQCEYDSPTLPLQMAWTVVAPTRLALLDDDFVSQRLSAYGRVRSEGTVLPLRLTHALVADLVAARRPTVTSALSDLARRGLVRSDGMLFGEAPVELSDLDYGSSAQERASVASTS